MKLKLGPNQTTVGLGVSLLSFVLACPGSLAYWINSPPSHIETSFPIAKFMYFGDN